MSSTSHRLARIFHAFRSRRRKEADAAPTATIPPSHDGGYEADAETSATFPPPYVGGYSLSAFRAACERSGLAAFLGMALVLALGCGAFADGPPELLPGGTFTVEFPDMPPTFAERLDKKNIPPKMTVFLPRNYNPQRKHPLLIFLGGGGGSRGQNPVVARKLTEETDFVCADLPLFKEKLDPAATGNGTARLILRENDCRYMWTYFQTMLAKLEAAVPNLDPAHRVLGGFSNGAHATAGLIDQSDGEIARRFSAFFFAEGGGRLVHYDLLKEKPFLMLYGSDKSGKRAKEIYTAAVAVGAKADIHAMNNVGHAFPESEYPAVRAWLRGPVLK